MAGARPAATPKRKLMARLPCRYGSYCANIGRTFFVDPNKDQEALYAVIDEAHAAAIAALVEGAPMSAAYKAAAQLLKVSECGWI